MLPSLLTCFSGTSTGTKPWVSRWTSTAAPSALESWSWAPTWRNHSGWITVLQQSVNFYSFPPFMRLVALFPHFVFSSLYHPKIFNLLTSSVSVTVDSCVSHYKAGQAFMVESGKKNTNKDPPFFTIWSIQIVMAHHWDRLPILNTSIIVYFIITELLENIN